MDRSTDRQLDSSTARQIDRQLQLHYATLQPQLPLQLQLQLQIQLQLPLPLHYTTTTTITAATTTTTIAGRMVVNWVIHKPLLVGFNPSEKYEFVSWDYSSQY